TLQQVALARGKKNTNREEQVLVLESLLPLANTPEKKIRVLLSLILALFDTATGTSGGMSTLTWTSTKENLGELLKTLETHRGYIVHETVPEDGDGSQKNGIVSIQGSIIALIEGLDNEFKKSLLSIDPLESEYVVRLKDEVELYALIFKSIRYFTRFGMVDEACRASVRRLEHIYDKPDPGIWDLDDTVGPNSGKDPSDLVKDICSYLHTNGSTFVGVRSSLLQVYHHAMHDRFLDARDLLWRLNLHETVDQEDLSTKMLYNRAMAQLGLCAFRQGKFLEAQECLKGFFSGQGGGSRTKELLGQELPHVPAHMHIDLDWIECTFLVCSMLLEIPGMVSAAAVPLLPSSSFVNQVQKKKKATTPFLRMLENYSRHIFLSPPPETMREHIFCASNALAVGNWQECVNLVFAIKIWDRPMTALVARGKTPELIKGMLRSKIQEEGIRVYLFSNQSHYSSIGLDQLAEMFELSKENVISIVSKMIWQDEFQARVDLHRGVVVMNSVESSQVQLLALALAARAVGLLEGNEKLTAAVRGGV
ncbi:Translation initiation factor 3 subunit c, partial [Gryganskiella cystojenkinii]